MFNSSIRLYVSIYLLLSHYVHAADAPDETAQAPSSAFPSLADAAKVKKVPPSKSATKEGPPVRRPRMSLAEREKLIQALTANREPMKPTNRP